MPAMSWSYDVIVVGLGPGGAGAAVELARNGARVLALNGAPRRSKPCGGCISHRWHWLFTWLAGAEDACPEWLWEVPVHVLRLGAPGRPPVERRTRPAGAYLVERSRLEGWLTRRAAESGVRIVNARARGLQTNASGYTIVSDAGEFRAPWLVGADGASSLVGRRLGLGRSRTAYLGLAEERSREELRLAAPRNGVELELGGVSSGYGWIFPRKRKVNLGMGFLARGRWRGRGAKGLVRAYARFLDRHGLGPPGRWRGAAIPCPDGGPLKAAAGRAAVVGDAGALADPFLGEGIGPALYTGRLAARAILAEDLGLYQAWLRRGLLKEHAHGRRMSRLVYGLAGAAQALASRRPGSLELGFCILRGELTQARIWSAALAALAGRSPALDPRAAGYYIKQLK